MLAARVVFAPESRFQVQIVGRSLTACSTANLKSMTFKSWGMLRVYWRRQLIPLLAQLLLQLRAAGFH